MKKEILSGNEAIARGFVEAGGKFAASYPGTPSTEVLEESCRIPGIHAEWSINEKVAFEAAIGGSISGLRSMASMKHVGVNVAADALMTASYTGVNAGLVLMAADDPGMFSSQNEQDTRHFARLAKVPCLEPSDSQEAKDFTKLAFEISEDFDTPVILRTTTRISHSKSVVAYSKAADVKPKPLQKKIKKYVMLPAFARKRHVRIEERLVRLMEWAETSEINQVIGPVNQPGGGGAVGAGAGAGLGIIASGAAFQYAREAFPGALILKLGMTWPLPERLIKKFAESVTKLAVVEELDPFIEDAVKAAGVRVRLRKKRPSGGGRAFTGNRGYRALWCALRCALRREGWQPRRGPSLAPADVLSGVFAQGPLRRALKAKSFRLGRYRLLYIGGRWRRLALSMPSSAWAQQLARALRHQPCGLAVRLLCYHQRGWREDPATRSGARWGHLAQRPHLRDFRGGGPCGRAPVRILWCGSTRRALPLFDAAGKRVDLLRRSLPWK